MRPTLDDFRAPGDIKAGRRPPPRPADGEFATFTQWVNKAQSRIGGTEARCFDALDRPCRLGADFMRARDEGAFPVRYYFL